MSTSPSRSVRVCARRNAAFRLFSLSPIVLACLGSLARASEDDDTPPPPAVVAQVELEPVVVHAVRTRSDARKLPFGVSVITARDIEDSGASTVNEVLMRVLGVPGRQDFYGGGEYAVDLRGFGSTSISNQVVVVDGIRLNEDDLSGSRLAGLPLEAVERIEVIRGNAGVLYGEGATGGAIVITTRDARGQALKSGARLSTLFGSNGLNEGRASGRWGSEGWGLDVAARKRRTDNHRQNFRSDAEAGAVGMSWQGDALRLSARLSRDTLDTGLPGGLSLAQFNEDPRQTTHAQDHARLASTQRSVRAELPQGDWIWSLDAGSRERSTDSLSVSSFGTTTYASAVDADSLALRGTHQGAVLGLKNRLNVGLERNRWSRGTQASYLSAPGDARSNARAVFGRNELTFEAGGILTLGARFEKVEKHNLDGQGIDRTMKAGEIGWLQPLSRNLSAYGRLARSYRLPNADEYSFSLGEIQPQTSNDVEAGLRWVRGGDRVEARLYQSRLRHEIGYDGHADGPYGPGSGSNVNFDPTRREGLELEAGHAMSSDLKLVGHLAWRRSRFTAGAWEGKDVPLAPRRTAGVRAEWKPVDAHRVAGGLTYVGAQHPGSDLANSCRMPGYVTADARYAYRKGNAEFALSGQNLTNHRYYTQAYECTGGVVGGVYPEAGRTVGVQLSLDF